MIVNYCQYFIKQFILTYNFPFFLLYIITKAASYVETQVNCQHMNICTQINYVLFYMVQLNLTGLTKSIVSLR